MTLCFVARDWMGAFLLQVAVCDVLSWLSFWELFLFSVLAQTTAFQPRHAIGGSDCSGWGLYWAGRAGLAEVDEHAEEARRQLAQRRVELQVQSKMLGEAQALKCVLPPNTSCEPSRAEGTVHVGRGQRLWPSLSPGDEGGVLSAGRDFVHGKVGGVVAAGEEEALAERLRQRVAARLKQDPKYARPRPNTQHRLEAPSGPVDPAATVRTCRRQSRQSRQRACGGVCTDCTQHLEASGRDWVLACLRVAADFGEAGTPGGGAAGALATDAGPCARHSRTAVPSAGVAIGSGSNRCVLPLQAQADRANHVQSSQRRMTMRDRCPSEKASSDWDVLHTHLLVGGDSNARL